jgi:hypothetical protein
VSPVPMTNTGDTPDTPQGPAAGGPAVPDRQGGPAAPAADAGGTADAGGGPSTEVTPEEAGKLEALLDELEGQDALEDKHQPFTDSYGLVLILLVTTFFVTAIAGDHQWGRIGSLLLLAGTTWLALRASRVQRRLLRWAVALIPVVTAVAVVATILGSEETSRGVAAALTVLLVVIGPFVIARRLVSHMAVDFNTFYGAICIYLLIAMFFASTYAFTSWVQGVPFFTQVHPPARAGSIDYLYFSFITITTVGYGDLTAASSVGRMTASCEAVLGQLYLITVVALVVQNLGQARHYRNIRKRLRK